MRYFFSFIVACIIISCQNEGSSINKNLDKEDKKEAREDSLALATSYRLQKQVDRVLYATTETTPIIANEEDDAADDPAIWVNDKNPHHSLIFGSNKKGGLAVYNLDGQQVDYYPLGNINNVDIIKNFPFGDSSITVLGCSNRSLQSIELHEIMPNGKLENLALHLLKMDSTLIDDIYGFCFAQESNDKHYAIINGKNGLLQQFEMVKTGSKVDLKLARSEQFDSQTEGMVSSKKEGYLYVGEEGKGIWKLNINPSKKDKKIFIHNSDESNTQISYDIEGLSIFHSQGQEYLVASSQGNFSYAVFDINELDKYIGSFKILDTDSTDGVEETDGLDIVSDSLSVAFPNGMLVFQDGFNYNGEDLQPQNFKYVDARLFIDILSSMTKLKEKDLK